MPAIIPFKRVIVVHAFVHVMGGSFLPRINLNIPPVAEKVVVEWYAEHDCYGLMSIFHVVGKHAHTSSSYRATSLLGSIQSHVSFRHEFCKTDSDVPETNYVFRASHL